MGGKDSSSGKKEKRNKIAHKVETKAKHQTIDVNEQKKEKKEKNQSKKEKKKEKKREKKEKKKEQKVETGDEAPAPDTTTTSSHHAFVANTLDHCETPLVAYQHIEPVLKELAKLCGMEPTKLRIWDPFYCDGAAKRHLEGLGFEAVIHENQDFYELIKSPQTQPPHDVFLTNPPYSDDHIERLLQYLSTQQEKPFCLLMPNWVARKRDYTNLMPKDVFYLSPVQPYAYNMPEWNSKPDHVGQDGSTTPYLSSWYIHVPEKNNERLRETLDTKSKRSTNNRQTTWVVAKTIKGLKWKIQKLK